MDKSILITTLLRQFETKFASTFFINGPPGAGKTHLLKDLADELPTYITNTQVLGPFNTAKDQVNACILEELYDLRFLESPAPAGIDEDWYSTWTWLRDNLKTSKRQNYLVLIRLDGNNFRKYDELKTWFSSLRYTEHYWTNDKIRLLIVIAGYWNHLGLENYYNEIQLSFPYTTSTNYISWNKISLDETIKLVSAKCNAALLSQSFGQLIYEITGGLAGAIMDVLKFLPSSNPSVAGIFFTTRRAAYEGEYGKSLVSSWSDLPAGSMEIVRELLLFGRLSSRNQRMLDLLVVAGILRYQDIFKQSFVRISSWYMELLLRNNVEVLGVDDDAWKKIEFQEFAPLLCTLNVEAYKIIHHIENLIRNFALTKLFEQNESADHVLQNKVLKRIQSYEKYRDEDAFDRATDWRERSLQNGIDVSLNPLITYLSTGDLVQLLREAGAAGDATWKEIVDTMEKVTPIRDAVMHNQVIDEKSLESLYSLQVKVYNALNW
jgi:hypothetical protein